MRCPEPLLPFCAGPGITQTSWLLTLKTPCTRRWNRTLSIIVIIWYLLAPPELINSGSLLFFLLLYLHHMLLVTCTGLFWAVALQCGKVKQTLENMPALWTHSHVADQGSKSLVSPASTGDLHSTPSQREQQTIACCHRPHKPNHKEEFTSHLSDKVGFKFHYENLMRKEMSLNRKLLTNWKASGQALIKTSGNECGSWSPTGTWGHLFPCPCPLVLQTERNYSGPQMRSSPNLHHMAQGCDCNRHHIPGD